MATLETRLNQLATAIGEDIKQLRLNDGNLTALSTTAKSNLVSAINEIYSMALAGTGVIDDNSGNGITDKTWSADKIYDSILSAINSLRTELTNGAGAALDTFAELAAAINNDATFAQTVATTLSTKVGVDAQIFTLPQQAQARSNIGAQAAAEIGNPDADLVAVYNAAKL